MWVQGNCGLDLGHGHAGVRRGLGSPALAWAGLRIQRRATAIRTVISGRSTHQKKTIRPCLKHLRARCFQSDG